MASLLGVNLSRVRLLTWVISAGISGIAGFLVAPLGIPSAFAGAALLLNGFIAAVFGGFGDPYRTLAGGVILGVVASFFGTYVSSAHAELLMFGVMFVTLAVRPAGLLVRAR
jgi:branched-chain amino acid transport system permease protein